MFSQAIAFLRFSYPPLALPLAHFYKLPFSSPETRTHDKDEKQSFVLISEGKSGGGRNFSARVQCQKVFICVFWGTTQREKAAHVPSWWLSDFLAYFLLFINEATVGRLKNVFFSVWMLTMLSWVYSRRAWNCRIFSRMQEFCIKLIIRMIPVLFLASLFNNRGLQVVYRGSNDENGG